MESGERHLARTLAGVGDLERERLFRMNITLCLHRALTEAEKAGLPAGWQNLPGGLAGGPVEVLKSRGIPETLESAKACRNPGHKVQFIERPDLWIPEDCRQCPPCQARMEIEKQVIRRRLGLPEPEGERENRAVGAEPQSDREPPYMSEPQTTREPFGTSEPLFQREPLSGSEPRQRSEPSRASEAGHSE